MSYSLSQPHIYFVFPLFHDIFVNYVKKWWLVLTAFKSCLTSILIDLPSYIVKPIGLRHSGWSQMLFVTRRFAKSLNNGNGFTAKASNPIYRIEIFTFSSKRPCVFITYFLWAYSQLSLYLIHKLGPWS